MIKLSLKKKKAQSDRNSWVLTHARRNLSARDAEEDKQSPDQFMQRWHKLRVQWFWWLFKWLFDMCGRVIWSDVCTGGRNPTSKPGMRNQWKETFYNGGWGGGVVSRNIIIMWVGVEINFCFLRGGGGYDSVLGHISPIYQPPPPPPGNYCTVP